MKRTGLSLESAANPYEQVEVEKLAGLSGDY